MCEKCDAIRAQLAAQGINSEDGMINLAKSMLQKLADVQVEVLVCGVLDKATGKPETMKLVREEEVSDIVERLHVVAKKASEMLDETLYMRNALDLMHSNLQAMSAIIEATNNPSAMKALAEVHNEYEKGMSALNNTREGQRAPQRAEVAAQAAELLVDPEVPEEVKAMISQLEGMIAAKAASKQGDNGTVH